ncbi:MAG: hypothetical protein EA382_15170 [Spirochaetaceae bacterium]|nr:MAG: hypothetical protein EA382_15170 [Spirochaetaceae bacterium]
MTAIRRSLLIAACCVAVVGCPTIPDAAPPAVSDPTTFLGLAVAEATRLVDRMERMRLYVDIADGYLAIDDIVSARGLARSALALGRDVAETEEGVIARVRMLALLGAIGDPIAATVMAEAVAFVDQSSDDRIRATLLPLIVQSALASGEQLRAGLRDTVDQVLIIEEPALRVETIVRVAQAYQAAEAGLSVAGLIQQAIPAARSVANPSRRLLLIASLARLATTAQDADLVVRLTRIAKAEVDGIGAIESVADSRYALQAIELFARAGAVDVSRRIEERLVDPAAVIRAAAVLARGAVSAAERRATLERVARGIDAIDDDLRRAETRLLVASELFDAAAPVRSTQLTSAVQSALVDTPRLQDSVELLQGVARLRVRLDQIGPLTELLDGARDEYIRGVIALAAAEQLIADNRFGLADDFLVVALLASDRATFLADALREQVVPGFVRTSSARLAIRTIERMEDRTLRARAVARFAVLAEPEGLMTSILRSDLASVLAGR